MKYWRNRLISTNKVSLMTDITNFNTGWSYLYNCADTRLIFKAAEIITYSPNQVVSKLSETGM